MRVSKSGFCTRSAPSLSAVSRSASSTFPEKITAGICTPFPNYLKQINTSSSTHSIVGHDQRGAIELQLARASLAELSTKTSKPSASSTRATARLVGSSSSINRIRLIGITVLAERRLGSRGYLTSQPTCELGSPRSGSLAVTWIENGMILAHLVKALV